MLQVLHHLCRSGVTILDNACYVALVQMHEHARLDGWNQAIRCTGSIAMYLKSRTRAGCSQGCIRSGQAGQQACLLEVGLHLLSQLFSSPHHLWLTGRIGIPDLLCNFVQ